MKQSITIFRTHAFNQPWWFGKSFVVLIWQKTCTSLATDQFRTSQRRQRSQSTKITSFTCRSQTPCLALRAGSRHAHMRLAMHLFPKIHHMSNSTWASKNDQTPTHFLMTTEYRFFLFFLGCFPTSCNEVHSSMWELAHHSRRYESRVQGGFLGLDQTSIP